MHAVCSAVGPHPPVTRPAARPASLVLPLVRQGTNSLSDANKLLIRCAWNSNLAFAFGPNWGPGTCRITDKAELERAVQAYDANSTLAIATYGSIADWDVSGITDMSYLFKDLKNFDADISNWDTSGVTNMNLMFYVRSSRAPHPEPPVSGPPLHAATLRRRRGVVARHLPPADPYTSPCTAFPALGRKRRRSTSR